MAFAAEKSGVANKRTVKCKIVLLVHGKKRSTVKRM